MICNTTIPIDIYEKDITIFLNIEYIGVCTPLNCSLFLFLLSSDPSDPSLSCGVLISSRIVFAYVAIYCLHVSFIDRWDISRIDNGSCSISCFWVVLCIMFFGNCWLFAGVFLPHSGPTWDSILIEFLQVPSCKLGHVVAWLCTCRPPPTTTTRRFTWDLRAAAFSSVGRCLEGLESVSMVSGRSLDGVGKKCGGCLKGIGNFLDEILEVSSNH